MSDRTLLVTGRTFGLGLGTSCVAALVDDTPDNAVAIKLSAIPAAATLDSDTQSAYVGQHVSKMKGAPREARQIINIFCDKVLGMHKAIDIDDPDDLPEKSGHQARRDQPQTNHRHTSTHRPSNSEITSLVPDHSSLHCAFMRAAIASA